MNREDAEKLSQKVVQLLEKERISRGVTKLYISQKTGLSRTAITLIANQQNSPTLRTLLQISSCIGVNLADIIKEVEKD